MLPVIMHALLAGSVLFLFQAVHAASGGTPNTAIRWTELTVPPGEPGFSRLDASSTGLAFTNVLDELTSAGNRTLENGAGVACGDFDADGNPDIFLCSLSGQSSLFRNIGQGHFQNFTVAAGLPAGSFPTRSAVFADINGDASLDLLVATIAEGIRCFTNSADGKFIESTSENLRSHFGITTLALADVDKNGTVDLYATTYRADDIRDRARIDIQRMGGRVVVAPALRDRIVLTPMGLFEFGEPDLLLLNDGNGNFTAANSRFLERRASKPKAPDKDWGLAATFRDMNSDGWPDLYICNDYWTPDRAWLNNAAGIFHPLAPEAIRHASENSMGVDFADINADGFLDFFITDMLSRDPARRHRHALAQATLPPELAETATHPHYMQNMLFVNRGDGTYAEVAEFAGVAASEWAWQPVFIDIDLDADPDLLIPAGHSRDVQDVDATEKIRRLQHAWPNMSAEEMQRAFTRELMEHARIYPRYDAPIVTFRNNGDLTFTDMTSEWGTDHQAVHQGLSCADFDGDGDIDFVVDTLNSPAVVYRNNAPGPRIAIRLRGRAPNTSAVGAVVTVRAEGCPTQQQEVVLGGRYLSGFDPQLTFAAPGEHIEVQIKWPDGKELRFPAEKNRVYWVNEAAAENP